MLLDARQRGGADQAGEHQGEQRLGAAEALARPTQGDRRAEGQPRRGVLGGRAQALATARPIGVEQGPDELALARAEHRLVAGGAGEGLVHLARAHEHRDARRQRDARRPGGRLQHVDGGLGVAQEQPHELAAPRVRGAGAMRVLLGEAGRGLRGDLIDTAEAGFGEPVEVLRPRPLVASKLGDPSPHRLCRQAIEPHQLVEAAPGPRLCPSEREVQVRRSRTGGLEPAVHGIGQAQPQIPFERAAREAGAGSLPADFRDRLLDDRRDARGQSGPELSRGRGRRPFVLLQMEVVRGEQISPPPVLPDGGESTRFDRPRAITLAAVIAVPGTGRRGRAKRLAELPLIRINLRRRGSGPTPGVSRRAPRGARTRRCIPGRDQRAVCRGAGARYPRARAR